MKTSSVSQRSFWNICPLSLSHCCCLQKIFYTWNTSNMRLANIKDFLLTPCIPVPFNSTVVWMLGINENLTLVSSSSSFSWRTSASMAICYKKNFRDLVILKTIWATSLLQRLHLVGATGQSLHVQGLCWLDRLLSESKFYLRDVLFKATKHNSV